MRLLILFATFTFCNLLPAQDIKDLLEYSHGIKGNKHKQIVQITQKVLGNIKGYIHILEEPISSIPNKKYREHYRDVRISNSLYLLIHAKDDAGRKLVSQVFEYLMQEIQESASELNNLMSDSKISKEAVNRDLYIRNLTAIRSLIITNYHEGGYPDLQELLLRNFYKLDFGTQIKTLQYFRQLNTKNRQIEKEKLTLISQLHEDKKSVFYKSLLTNLKSGKS